MDSLNLLHRYLSRVRVRRELAEIHGDEDSLVDARECEDVAHKAIQLIAAGRWDELDQVSKPERESVPPPVPSRSYSDLGI